MGERKIKSFEDLEVWQVCRDLRKTLTGLARKLPQEEKFRLTDQIIRAARSITNNIAEGYGRYHFQENMQFCRQSRGSLYEIMDHLIICVEEKYLPDDNFNKLKSDCERAIMLLNGFIRYLQKQKKAV